MAPELRLKPMASEFILTLILFLFLKVGLLYRFSLLSLPTLHADVDIV